METRELKIKGLTIKAVLISAHFERTDSPCCRYLQETLYAQNRIVLVTYFCKNDASGSIKRLEDLQILAEYASVPEWDDLLKAEQ